MADDPHAARRRASRRDRDPGAVDDQATPPDTVAQGGSSDVDAAASSSEPTADGESVSTAEPGLEPESTSDGVEGDESHETDATDGEPTPETMEPTPETVGISGSTEDEPAGDDTATAPVPAAAGPERAPPDGAPHAAVEPEPADPEPEPPDDAAVAAAATTLWESPDGTPTASLPWLQARSPDDRICPFLRAVAADEHLGFPVDSPDAANRCASMHEAVPQSLRQQELVCLTANHVNCPRYLRGAADTATEAPVVRVRPKAVMTPAISAALIILALSFGASVVFGLANGGLAMPSRAAVVTPPASASSVAAAASATPATATPVPSPAGASPSLEPTPGPSATPIASPSATPIPSPSASASAGTGPTAAPTSNRFRLLKACPNKPNCWIYTVRSGDNLYSIANYFGVPLSTVRSLNPWTKTESLRAGRQLILPNPTR